MKPDEPDRGQPTFDDFKRLARDQSLSRHEKIDFPDAYRQGKEELIFQDVSRKLPNLGKRAQTVLDIGPGCSGPAFMLIEMCHRQDHKLVLIDSEEMLGHLPNEPFIEKCAGRFPDECDRVIEKYREKIDAIICYSVLHYVFAEASLFDFLDKSLNLLSEGGEMLIGDIPNISKRRRFFSSPTGVRFHQDFMKTKERPTVNFNQAEPGKIDDAVLLGLMLRARAAGFDAYLLPQPDDLPMANRREDLLIQRP